MEQKERQINELNRHYQREGNFRIGSKVKIIESSKKQFIGKEGKIVDKRVSYFGNKDFLVVVTFTSGNYKCIWQSKDDLVRIK